MHYKIIGDNNEEKTCNLENEHGSTKSSPSSAFVCAEKNILVHDFIFLCEFDCSLAGFILWLYVFISCLF